MESLWGHETPKRPIRYWLTYLWTFPWDIPAWFVVLLIWLFWGTKLQWLEGLWCELKPNSWPTRTWYRKRNKNGAAEINDVEDQPTLGRWKTWGGTTVGHRGFFGPSKSGGEGIDTPIEVHEHFHVEQYEAAMLAGLILSGSVFLATFLTGGKPIWVMHIAMWVGFWAFSYSMSALQAWLRGESGYRGSHLEEGAYAIAAEYAKKQHGIK